jgi:hypothetical protein
MPYLKKDMAFRVMDYKTISKTQTPVAAIPLHYLLLYQVIGYFHIIIGKETYRY